MITILKQADTKGLDPEDYDGTLWSARIGKLRSASTTDLAHFDLALTVSVMRYLSDLHLGRVNPRYFHFGFDVEHNKYDLSHFVRERLVSSPDVEAPLATAEPPFGGYRRTEKALRLYLQLAQRDDGERLTIPMRPVVLGDRYSGTKRLQRLLCLLGDLQADACLADAGDVYTSLLADGVTHFQGRHGLQQNGHLDEMTIRELNVPLSERVSQLQLTLERWRWLPHEFSQPPIIVNIPEFRLRAIDQNDKVVLAMNVVVGRAFRRQTPVFAKDMKFVIFRPYWNVPLSIQRSEIVPAIERDRSYITKKDYEVVTRGGDVVTNGPISDSILQRLRDGTLAVRQRPGPRNALGLVKLISQMNTTSICTALRPRSYSRDRVATSATDAFVWKTRLTLPRGYFATTPGGTKLVSSQLCKRARTTPESTSVNPSRFSYFTGPLSWTTKVKSTSLKTFMGMTQR